MYVSRKILAQQSDGTKRTSGQGMSTADDRGGSKQKTLYTYLSIHPVWRTLLKEKMPSYFIFL